MLLLEEEEEGEEWVGGWVKGVGDLFAVCLAHTPICILLFFFFFAHFKATHVMIVEMPWIMFSSLSSFYRSWCGAVAPSP